MKIMNLTENSKIYTSNVFLVLGTWNSIDDINTLIDVGSDDSIFEKIENINTGLGKRKIDRVVLTHSHSDHASLLPKIIELYNPQVCAFNSHIKGIDRILRDGDIVRIGEQAFEVFHITAHSYDSICLYGEGDGILFAGDTTFPLRFENDVLRKENAYVIDRLKGKKITKVYSGHGEMHDFTNKRFEILIEEGHFGGEGHFGSAQ
jgi:glyoxylase-like metal-dependent hydrolase (beta-lactamase superfamily II)